jgi:putative hydrolase of the HAD superfamily
VRNITTVIFDLGRVLVELRTDGAAFSALMRGMGIDPARAFEQFWHHPEVIGHSTGTVSPQDFYRRAVEEFGLAGFEYERFAQCWCDLFRPMPGMEALFSEVAARCRVGILSDTDPLHWERIRTLLPCVAAVERPTLSYEVGHLKPHPAMYRAAAANAGVPPEECLFIDDLAGNVEGARAVGMRAVRFAGAEALRRELENLGVL